MEQSSSMPRWRNGSRGGLKIRSPSVDVEVQVLSWVPTLCNAQVVETGRHPALRTLCSLVGVEVRILS